jgi:glutamyl-tRNA synthetase
MPDPTPASIRVRIAPSPTGDPHVGTAYIGLLNFIFARQRAGQFVLRIEDTDRSRFVSTSEAMIFDSLRWLGVTWDEGPDVGGPFGPYRQSERTEIYREHVQQLLASGHAYRSFETAEELEAMRKSQLAAKLPPRYNGAHRELPQSQIDAFLAEGRPYVIRLKVPAEGETAFRDELRGAVTFSHNNVDDQVLLKSDGFPTYHLANVVDDHLMRITDVIRAEEWISSTPKHVLLYKAFGWELPRFWHMPLLRNLDKSKISKRKNPVSLIYYRDSGYLPQALLNFLGLMGGGMTLPTNADLNNKESDIFSIPDMIQRFDFERIALGGPVFDLTKLKWLNGEYIRKMSKSDFVDHIRETAFSKNHLLQIAAFVQNRIETVNQFIDVADFLLKDEIKYDVSVWKPSAHSEEETLLFTEELLSALEASDWNGQAIERSVLSAGSVRVLRDFPLTKKSESTKNVYTSAVRLFFSFVASNRHRLGLTDDSTQNEFQEWMAAKNYEPSTIATYFAAVRDLSRYISENHGEWTVAESFMLLRAIITGSRTSPPILECLEVFGKARTLDRIRRFLDTHKRLASTRNTDAPRSR